MKLGVCQVHWVQGAQKGICFNALIKSLDESVKGLIIADPGIDFSRLIIHSQVEVRPLTWHTLGAVYPLSLHLSADFITKTHSVEVINT